MGGRAGQCHSVTLFFFLALAFFLACSSALIYDMRHARPLTPPFHLQPMSVTFIWSRAKLIACARNKKANATANANANTSRAAQAVTERGNDGAPVATRSVRAARTWRSYLPPRRTRGEAPKPPAVPRPSPEAIQVAVMIAMPSPLPPKPGSVNGPRYVGHSGVGEYQIGVMRMPWPSGEGP